MTAAIPNYQLELITLADERRLVSTSPPRYDYTRVDATLAPFKGLRASSRSHARFWHVDRSGWTTRTSNLP
jgi:hypothetical protein